MSKRKIHIASIAEELKTYRSDELGELIEEHVERWVQQFTEEHQLTLLEELDHIFKESFVSEKSIKEFLKDMIETTELVGDDPHAFWKAANFLSIQRKGQSQKAMLEIFANCLVENLGIQMTETGSEDETFIYLDDITFTGSRVYNDLSEWVKDSAPDRAILHVIVAVTYTGSYYFENRLREMIGQSSKRIDLHYWFWIILENRKNQRNASNVLWPASLPQSDDIQNFIATHCNEYSFALREAKKDPQWPFKTEEGRQIVEQEFLKAGLKIKGMAKKTSESLRPLGFSPFGLGFGAMIATYRNCPNNAPLALWWGDREAKSGALNWYPLLPRKTYSSIENILNDFDQT